jgi:hypothetical protein
VAEAAEWIGDDKDLWQVWRELRGIEECIRAEGALLTGKSVLVLSDAVGAVKYINDGAGQSVEMTSIMKRIFRQCVKMEICLRAEHLSGSKMKESGVDSLSRWGEFEVNAGVFKSFNEHPKWGGFGGASGYTVDLYASTQSAKCERYCARGGAVACEVQWPPVSPTASAVCIGDARVVKLGPDENVWVCPPLSVVHQAVAAFMEMRTLGTVVVPDWVDQPWYLYLRQRSVASTPLPWSRQSPTMVDSVSHGDDSHGVNKWGFRAFLVDNRGGRAALNAEGVVRHDIPSAPSRSRLTLTDPAEECGGRRLSRILLGRPLRVLDLCSGLGSIPWLITQLGVRSSVSEVELDGKA